MRKIILFSLVSISSHLMAQKSFWGVDAGINVANQREVAYANPKLKNYNLGRPTVKPSFGIFYQYGISNAFAVRANAVYMAMGYDNRVFAPYNVDISYLTFPVTFQYKANEHFSISAGPYLSFTVGGTKINNDNITKTYHKNDYGFSIGAEHDVYKNFALSLKYFFGLKNIWLADTYYDPFSGLTYHYQVTNRAMQVTLIYKFRKPTSAK